MYRLVSVAEAGYGIHENEPVKFDQFHQGCSAWRYSLLWAHFGQSI